MLLFNDVKCIQESTLTLIFSPHMRKQVLIYSPLRRIYRTWLQNFQPLWNLSKLLSPLNLSDRTSPKLGSKVRGLNYKGVRAADCDYATVRTNCRACKFNDCSGEISGGIINERSIITLLFITQFVRVYCIVAALRIMEICGRVAPTTKPFRFLKI